MLSRDDLERERYEARLKLQRDAISLIDAHETELIEKTALARAEGVMIGRIHFGQRLLQQTVTPEADLLAMSLEELTHLAEALEQELLNRPR